MTRKLLALLLSLLLLCTMSTAFAAENKGVVRIVLCENPETVYFVDNLLPEFIQKTGIQVETDVLPSASYYEKMVLGMVNTTQDWDICQVDISCAGTLLDGGYLMPIDGLIASASPEYLKGYEGTNLLTSSFSYNGKPYGIPEFMGTSILMYNAQDFLDVGLDPDAPPKTMDELVEACKLLDRPSEDKAAIVFRGSREGATISFFWSMLYFSQGGSWYPSDHESLAIFDTDAALKATQIVVELGKYAPEGIANYTYDECYNDIQQGKASMLVDMSQCATWTLDPKLSTVSKDMRFSAFDGRTLAGNWNFCIGENCENPDLAWQLIEYMTGYDVAWAQTKQLVLSAPCRTDILGNPELLDIYPADLIKAMQDSQKDCDAVFYPMCSQCDEIVTDLAININDALTGTITAEEAMARTQKEVLDIKTRDGLK